MGPTNTTYPNNLHTSIEYLYCAGLIYEHRVVTVTAAMLSNSASGSTRTSSVQYLTFTA